MALIKSGLTWSDAGKSKARADTPIVEKMMMTPTIERNMGPNIVAIPEGFIVMVEDVVLLDCSGVGRSGEKRKKRENVGPYIVVPRVSVQRISK